MVLHNSTLSTLSTTQKNNIPLSKSTIPKIRVLWYNRDTSKAPRKEGTSMTDTILLNTKSSSGVTCVSNLFITQYMAKANGDYVKVYLYLLHCFSNHCPSFSVSEIADLFDDTDKDILRAFSYWEKAGLLSIQKKKDGSIGELTLIDPEEAKRNEQKAAAVSVQTPKSSASLEFHNTPIAPHTKIQRPEYSPKQVQELTNNDEVKWLLNIIETYMEHPLRSGDLQLVLFLYESMDFSAELIMYLYEYCISKNKKNPSYIEAVALAWAEKGIDTVEKAEQAAIEYNNSYNAVTNAFGLNRSPVAIERQFIDKWFSTYGFDIPIIVEACNRTILQAHKPDFKYADRILESWKKSGVHHLSDIKALDAKHENQTKQKQINTTNTKTTQPQQKPPVKTNAFHAFPQRSYSQDDYSSLEKKLLEKTYDSAKNK